MLAYGRVLASIGSSYVASVDGFAAIGDTASVTLDIKERKEARKEERNPLHECGVGDIGAHEDHISHLLACVGEVGMLHGGLSTNHGHQVMVVLSGAKEVR
jgi:hypothetical protein